jgi:hypothetical protein
MYLFAKLHPHLKECEGKNYDGIWFSSDDMKRQINKFYCPKKGGFEIPLCIDHRDVGKFGYVKEGDVVGRVLDLFCNKENELMFKCVLDNTHKAYKEVNQGIFKSGEKWGVSVGIALRNDKEGKRHRNLVHVALTTDPGFKEYDTYLFKWSIHEDIINAAIGREYIKDAKVFSPQFEAKIKGIFRFYLFCYFIF